MLTSHRPAIKRLIFAAASLGVLGGVWWFVVEGGRFLQREDTLQHADAIFVLAGTHLERPLEAVDLYKGGYAPLVVLSPGRTEPAEWLVRAKGVDFPPESRNARNALVQLGVPAAAVLELPESVDNTAAEANLLRELVISRRWTRVIIVTSKYHLRRAGFAFRRGLQGTTATAIMHSTRYDPSDPAHWWRRRADIRFAGSEWVKLLLYWCGLSA
jgi:uncharacterized SAM-binding protein YcdF (DUF218 family)